MKNVSFLAVIVCMMVAINSASAEIIRGINIDFVTIGNAGNAADTGGTPGCGVVSYNYRIGKYEVTNAQWNAFTFAAGAPTGNPSSAYDQSAYFTGTQQPTNRVSWCEAAQFCNYLTSGQKYSGAYQFDQSGNFLGIDRVWSISTYGTTYVIPTENEWYKAAYYKPNGSGYSLYASNTTPIVGVESNYNGAIGHPWDVTNGVQEQNGTFNMMGNVWEWNETLFYGSSRGVRGGSYGGDYNNGPILRSSYWASSDPYYDGSNDTGFRIASVPEPCSLVLLFLGGLVLRRKK